MPTSFGLECPHLHCTRVHNKGLQRPTSPCARAQLKTRAPKRCPRRPSLARVQEDAHVDHVIRAWKDARVGLLARVQEDARVATSCARLPVARVQRCPCWPRHPRVGLHSRRPKMAASTSTRAKMHASPATLAPKMAASKAVTEFETWSCRLYFSSHVLPTIRSDVRRGFGYK